MKTCDSRIALDGSKCGVARVGKGSKIVAERVEGIRTLVDCGVARVGERLKIGTLV